MRGRQKVRLSDFLSDLYLSNIVTLFREEGEREIPTGEMGYLEAFLRKKGTDDDGNVVKYIYRCITRCKTIYSNY